MNLIIGTLIDSRYRISGLLGSGGMGTVYSALDLELDRPVAIKILHKQYSDNNDEQIERLKREAQALSQIDHKNVIRVFSMGIGPESLPYLVMELLQGETLCELLQKQHALPAVDALDILLQVANGMVQAHAKEIVHRDLKPQNIFLVKGNNEITVKVLDFGLCRQYQDQNELQKLTATGLLLGSINYMSSESSLGRPATKKSDIYSMGVILYETVSGERPFNAETPVGVLYKQANEAAPMLSKKFPFLEDASAFDRIIQKCLAKDPSQRYESMDALDQELLNLSRELKDQKSTSASKAALPTRILNNARKTQSFNRRFYLVSALVVVAVLTFGISFHLAQSNKATQSPEAVNRDEVIKSVPRKLRSLKAMLATLEIGSKTEPAAVERAIALTDSWLKLHSLDEPSLDLLDAQIIKAEWLGRSQRVADTLESEAVLKRVLSSLPPGDDLRQLECKGKLAMIYYKRKPQDLSNFALQCEDICKIWKRHSKESAYARAAYPYLNLRANAGILANPGHEEALRQSVEIAPLACGSASPEYALALGGLADYLFDHEQYKEASSLSEQALAIAANLDPVDHAMALEHQAKAIIIKGDNKSALASLHSASELLHSSPGNETFKARIWIEQAECLIDSKQFIPARSMLKNAEKDLVESATSAAGNSATVLEDRVNLYLNLARLYFETGDKTSSLRIWSRVQRQCPEKLGALVQQKARDLCLKSSYGKACCLLESALAPGVELSANWQGKLMVQIGSIYFDNLREYSKASTFFAQGEKLLGKTAGGEVDRAVACTYLSLALEKLAHLDESRRYMQLAVELFGKGTDSTSSTEILMGVSLCRLAFQDESAGQYKDAIGNYKKSILKLKPLNEESNIMISTQLEIIFLPRAFAGLSNCYLHLGDRKSALENYRLSRAAFDKLVPRPAHAPLWWADEYNRLTAIVTDLSHKL